MLDCRLLFEQGRAEGALPSSFDVMQNDVHDTKGEAESFKVSKGVEMPAEIEIKVAHMLLRDDKNLLQFPFSPLSLLICHLAHVTFIQKKSSK